MGLTVVIADPRELLRLGVHTLFEQDPRVSDVHQAETFDELIAVLAVHQDQIDLVMVAQELIGIESRIELLPRDKFAILTSRPELAILRAAVKHGARGYLTESVSGELVRTLLRPAAGTFLLDPALTAWMIGLLREEQTHSAEELLTPRELEVYRLLQRGISKQEITALLHIAEATVDTHIKNIKRKFRGDRPEEE